MSPLVRWSAEHEAVLVDWMKKYPKGKSINTKQIEYADPERWKQLVDAGHKPKAMIDKVYAINYRKEGQRGSGRATYIGGGKYECNACGEVVAMKQMLPAHYRMHNQKKQLKSLAPITTVKPQNTTTTPKNTAWHYCPNCAFPLNH